MESDRVAELNEKNEKSGSDEEPGDEAEMTEGGDQDAEESEAEIDCDECVEDNGDKECNDSKELAQSDEEMENEDTDTDD